ncbi:MAG TPA: galactokinase [Jatrophihabitans sp.]|uniref:galactokinase n=1 Tax=Jatrophihabitans sp. TaxID=1932789 RepID=UPI002DFBFDC1|nr:galactokinase [Jatrophihabitans sp.]
MWRAPGRVNLIGEHTDYNDGFVAPIALPLGITARVTATTDGAVHARSVGVEPARFDLAGLAPGTVEGWAAYVAGVVWALAERGHDITGADIDLDGDVPHGAGLSSSAALECVVAIALDDVFGLGLTRDELIAVARRAENDYVGLPNGVLDQSASLLCRAGHVLLLDTRSGERRHVPFDLAAAGLALLVIDTRAPHRLVDGEYAARRRDCEAAAAELGMTALRDVVDLVAALAALTDERLRHRVRHVVTENARVLEVMGILDGGGDLRAIGPVLIASHMSLRDDYEVSSPELDLAVSAALGAGAHGARMTGGGFGGSAIALVDAASADDVTAAVTAGFAAAGFGPPSVFAAVAADGAHRVEV